MKTSNRLLGCSFVLLGAMLLFNSCKKKVVEELPQESIASTGMAGNNCKPVVLGVYSKYSDGQNYWNTIMQKWYGSDGKLEYLNANFYRDPHQYSYLHLSIVWAKLVYTNNTQVYFENRYSSGPPYLTMRVTLDEQGRPVSSNHFHDVGSRDTRSHIRDLSYYYFTGKRLDSTISYSTENYGSQTVNKYTFYYDTYGNLQVVTRNDGQYESGNYMQLKYDYSKPVAGMQSPLEVTVPYKLLEYMDLLHFPIRHQLIEVTANWRNLYNRGAGWKFTNHTLQENGFTHSYNASQPVGAYSNTYYTGWECGSATPGQDPTNRQRNSIKSLEDFEQAYPKIGKQ
jgi:hypothetical protein